MFRLLPWLVGIGMLAAHASPALAEWPADQPIRIIVPQPAGGTNDTAARLVGNEMGKLLGQSVVVENRPGAAGSIGTQAIAHAKPDGYTVGIASDSSTLMNVTRSNLSWHFPKDFVGVGLIGEQPISVAVPAQSPYRSLAEIVTAAKANPEAIAYGSSGVGSSQHIVGEWLGSLAGAKFTHIPYKGGGQAITDLIANQIPMAVLGLAPLLPQDRNGKVRIVAVTTLERAPALPNVPTLTELGYPEIALAQFVGLVAPEGVPVPVLERLSKVLQTVLAMPHVQEKLGESGLQTRAMGSADFTAYLQKTSSTWSTLVPKLKLTLE